MIKISQVGPQEAVNIIKNYLRFSSEVDKRRFIELIEPVIEEYKK